MFRIFVQFIKSSLAFGGFLFRVLLNGNYSSVLAKTGTGKTIAVLANGPSLKEELSRLTMEEEFKNVDFIVLNFFAFEETFFKIKPTHYCFADPMFFHKNHKAEQVNELFKRLDEKVTWQMNIYIPSTEYKKFKEYSGLRNKNINVIKINNTIYSGYESLRNFFYKVGLGAPCFATVANLAILVALNRGYSKINLYGVDHTFFDSLCVNDQNQLCNRDLHFYDDNTVALKPILRNDNDQVWKISEYLEAISVMFKSHDLLFIYSQYLGIDIINFTKKSMIDSYKRISYAKPS